MATPAERYAAARKRSRTSPHLAAFRDRYDFPLDTFQVQACEALDEGRDVLVAAPTGSGKTVVGEYAIHLARETGRKAFYTTPIKALSNQKYRDLVAQYGETDVGLLTGDVSINGHAQTVVMTTEVLRNMVYESSPDLTGLGYVVLDEVHYLADRERGAVWEELIIQLPESVAIAALSATVSNVEEFGAWMATVRGDTQIVLEEHRPVPLWQQVMAPDNVSPEGLSRLKATYARDVAVLPPAGVAAIIAAAGFAPPVQFFQAGLIHAWFASRLTSNDADSE